MQELEVAHRDVLLSSSRSLELSIRRDTSRLFLRITEIAGASTNGRPQSRTLNVPSSAVVKLVTLLSRAADDCYAAHPAIAISSLDVSGGATPTNADAPSDRSPPLFSYKLPLNRSRLLVVDVLQREPSGREVRITVAGHGIQRAFVAFPTETQPSFGSPGSAVRYVADELAALLQYPAVAPELSLVAVPMSEHEERRHPELEASTSPKPHAQAGGSKAPAKRAASSAASTAVRTGVPSSHSAVALDAALAVPTAPSSGSQVGASSSSIGGAPTLGSSAVVGGPASTGNSNGSGASDKTGLTSALKAHTKRGAARAGGSAAMPAPVPTPAVAPLVAAGVIASAAQTAPAVQLAPAAPAGAPDSSMPAPEPSPAPRPSLSAALGTTSLFDCMASVSRQITLGDKRFYTDFVTSPSRGGFLRLKEVTMGDGHKTSSILIPPAAIPALHSVLGEYVHSIIASQPGELGAALQSRAVSSLLGGRDHLTNWILGVAVEEGEPAPLPPAAAPVPRQQQQSRAQAQPAANASQEPRTAAADGGSTGKAASVGAPVAQPESKRGRRGRGGRRSAVAESPPPAAAGSEAGSGPASATSAPVTSGPIIASAKEAPAPRAAPVAGAPSSKTWAALGVPASSTRTPGAASSSGGSSRGASDPSTTEAGTARSAFSLTQPAVASQPQKVITALHPASPEGTVTAAAVGDAAAGSSSDGGKGPKRRGGRGKGRGGRALHSDGPAASPAATAPAGARTGKSPPSLVGGGGVAAAPQV